MSRSKRFVTGLLSSYAAIGVNILYTLASVPLALHYLDKEEFGLWALITQLSGYLMLLEFGMSGSVARSLSDHKDHMEDGIYGSILRTGARVFAIQGFLVAVLGIALAWLAPPLLGLPSRLQQPFSVLMAAQAILSGIRLSLSSLGSPLWCHQRLDLSNLVSSLSLIATFIVLWIGFHLGWHTYSLIASTTAGTILGSILNYLFCRWRGYYPPNKYQGHFDPSIFRELFNFGGGLFLMNVGAQLASASQIVLISRMLGMEATTVWSISTKIFSLAQQFVARVLDSSAGGLAEMVVRKESTQLQKRFHDLVSISAVMAVSTSTGIALMNGPFIEIWTSGKITWAPWNNYLLSCVLFSIAVTRCHIGLVGISKQIRGMKYVYLIEGLAFISLSVLLTPRIGLTGLLIAALICNVAITGIYGIIRTSSYFGISRLAVAGWITRPFCIMLVLAAIFPLTQIPFFANSQPLLQLIIEGTIFSILAIPAIWFFGMPANLRSELSGFIVKIIKNAKSRIKPASI